MILKFCERRVFNNSFLFWFLIAFACEHCDRKYAYKQDLNKHLQTHVGNVYNCEECGERFRLLIELQRHSFQHYKSDNAVNQSVGMEKWKENKFGKKYSLISIKKIINMNSKFHILFVNRLSFQNCLFLAKIDNECQKSVFVRKVIDNDSCQPQNT